MKKGKLLVLTTMGLLVLAGCNLASKNPSTANSSAKNDSSERAPDSSAENSTGGNTGAGGDSSANSNGSTSGRPISGGGGINHSGDSTPSSIASSETSTGGATSSSTSKPDVPDSRDEYTAELVMQDICNLTFGSAVLDDDYEYDPSDDTYYTGVNLGADFGTNQAYLTQIIPVFANNFFPAYLEVAVEPYADTWSDGDAGGFAVYLTPDGEVAAEVGTYFNKGNLCLQIATYAYEEPVDPTPDPDPDPNPDPDPTDEYTCEQVIIDIANGFFGSAVEDEDYFDNGDGTFYTGVSFGSNSATDSILKAAVNTVLNALPDYLTVSVATYVGKWSDGDAGAFAELLTPDGAVLVAVGSYVYNGTLFAEIDVLPNEGGNTNPDPNPEPTAYTAESLMQYLCGTLLGEQYANAFTYDATQDVYYIGFNVITGGESDLLRALTLVAGYIPDGFEVYEEPAVSTWSDGDPGAFATYVSSDMSVVLQLGTYINGTKVAIQLMAYDL